MLSAGMNQPTIILHIYAYLSLETFITNEISVDFDVSVIPTTWI